MFDVVPFRRDQFPSANMVNRNSNGMELLQLPKNPKKKGTIDDGGIDVTSWGGMLGLANHHYSDMMDLPRGI